MSGPSEPEFNDLHGRKADSRRVLVLTKDNHRLDGWVIRSDVVMVLEAGLELPLQVLIGRLRVPAIQVGDDRAPGRPPRYSAILLPAGSIEVDGDELPSGVEPPPDGSEADPSGRERPTPCIFFPWLPGC